MSAEVFRAYKPDPRTYGGVAETFDVPPEQVMLVATHHNDLEGARACRLQTAISSGRWSWVRAILRM